MALTANELGRTANESTTTSSTPTQKRLSAEQRVVQILDVAEVLFAENTFHATSVEDIARAAGISRAIVYNHFGSKEGLVVAIVRRAREELGQASDNRLSALGEDATEEELWLTVGENYLEQIELHPTRWAVVYAAPTVGDTQLASRMYELRQDTIERVAKILRSTRQGQSADPIRIDAYAQAISGVGELLARWALVDVEGRREEFRRAYAQFIMHGTAGLN